MQHSSVFKPRRKKRKFWLLIPAILVLLAAAQRINLLKPPPTNLDPEIHAASNSQVQGHASISSDLPWPKYGQSAVGVKGYGVLAASQENAEPVPIASLAKVVTALAILETHPLVSGEHGPNLTLTEQDIEFFNTHSAQNGTVTKVVLGQNITEYQALQAMLIPSSNNMADSLAVWAFGSQENYVSFANQYVRQLGLKDTYIADANGFSPKNTSTAADLVLLGEYALNNPVIAEIVAQWEIKLPEAGSKYNTNRFLDYHNNGVVGIKSGETDQAGGTYLVAANRMINGQQVTFIAAVLGAPTHFTAQKDAIPILEAASRSLNLVSKPTD